MNDPADAATLLRDALAGDRAAIGPPDELRFPELRRAAHARLRNHADALLVTTALVHESYERLVGSVRPGFTDQSHFLACAARVMRSVLVDLARELLPNGAAAARRTWPSAPARASNSPRPSCPSWCGCARLWRSWH